MNSFKQWKSLIETATWANNPADDIDQYLTGLSNRLMLLRPEELVSRKEKLIELRELINDILQRKMGNF